MAVLADLERLFERVFERPTARLFRARLAEVQVVRRVERSMERARTGHGTRTVVPARYRVRLHPRDLGALSGDDGPEALAGRLADAALAFARAHGYHLPGRPTISLVADPAVDPGTVEVDAVGPGRAAGSPRAPVPDVPVLAPRPGPAATADVPSLTTSPTAQPTVPGSPGPTVGAALASALFQPDVDARQPVGGIRGDGTETLVFRRPAPVPVQARLRVVARDGAERVVEVDGTPLTLGRGTDNRLVLADARVSRHHARLQTRRGTLVFTDLGSTNGSRVNGVRVDECALGTGDRVQVGDTILLVEQLPG
jgi:hypothetical protein